MKKANIKDKNGKEVRFGDTFWAYITRPSPVAPTLVTVVEDTSKENVECYRNYDVEDAEGNRLWNSYMVIASCGEYGSEESKWDGGKEWLRREKESLLPASGDSL